MHSSEARGDAVFMASTDSVSRGTGVASGERVGFCLDDLPLSLDRGVEQKLTDF